MRNAVREVRRAVDRIDHPERIACHPMAPPSSPRNASCGKRAFSRSTISRSTCAVGFGDVVLLALELDLDRLGEQLARQLARLARHRDQRLLPGIEFLAYHLVQYRRASGLRQSWPMRA